MEHFAQTNVFARIRTVFAHLIIGCAIRYPKIGNLHYRLNYLDFYFVYSSAMLLIVLEVHFSLLFSNKTDFRVCFVACKIRSPLFFMSIPTIRY